MSVWEYTLNQEQELRSVTDDLIKTLKLDFTEPNRNDEAGLIRLANWRAQQFKIMGQLQIALSIIDSVWQKRCEGKDNYFYRRSLPNMVVPAPEAQPITPEEIAKAKPAAKPAATQVQRKIRDLYDISQAVVFTRKIMPQVLKITNDGLAKHQTPIEDTMFQVVETHMYCSWIRKDQALWIIEKLIARKMYGAFYMFLATLALHPDTTHVIFDYPIMKVVAAETSPFHDPRYKDYFWYLYSYSLHFLNREEMISSKTATPASRHLLDARSLVLLPKCLAPITNHPLMPLPLPIDDIHKPGRPINPLGQLEDRGVYNPEIFKIRFRVFSDGIFEGLDLSSICFAGSVIPACLYKSPLERIFGLDIHNTSLDYWNSEATIKSLKAYFSEYYPGKELFNPSWLATLSWQQIDVLENNLSDLDVIIECLSDQEFDRIALRIYRNIQKALNLENPTQAQLQMMKVKTASKYKYFISGSALRCSLEVFHPTTEAYREGCINRFHLGIVRACYSNDRIWLTPSAFTYAVTGCISNYRWFVSTKPPEHTFLKYAIRGCYPILNEGEWARIGSYMNSTPMWKPMLDWSPELGLNSPVWRPRAYGLYNHHDIAEAIRGMGANPSQALLPNTTEYKICNPSKEPVHELPKELAMKWPGGGVRPPQLGALMTAATKLINSTEFGY